MADAPTPPDAAVRRVLVLGANGPSGRLVVQQALDRGLAVRALTRHPEAFPVRDPRLEVVAGDATDAVTVEAAVRGCDAVVSVIGTAYTWEPVRVYSTSARLVVDAMRRHGVRRLIAVTSMGVSREVRGPGVVRPLLEAVWRRTFTRTLYDDMLRMERTVSRSGLDWTIVRPPGLSLDPPRGYRVAEGRIDGPAMSRADLAAVLLDQLDDREWVGRVAAVMTPGLRLELVKTIRTEVLKR